MEVLYMGGVPPLRDPGEGFKRAWPPLIKMDEAVRKEINSLFGNAA